MFFKAKEIIGKKVITQSNQVLGRVSDFDVDSTGQRITKYYCSGGLIKLIEKPLMINSSQVIQIKEDRIIVEDTLISEKAPDVEYVR